MARQEVKSNVSEGSAASCWRVLATQLGVPGDDPDGTEGAPGGRTGGHGHWKR